MSLRFLATGDLQIHDWSQFSHTTKSGMNSRLRNCLRVFHIIRREAKRRGITKLLINGDVFEETNYIRVEVYDAAYRELERTRAADIETVVNIGNHDIALQSRQRTLHNLRPFRKVVHIVEKPRLVWGALGIVPYAGTTGQLRSGIAHVAAAEASVLVLHAGVSGAKVGPKNYVLRSNLKLKDLRPKAFRLVMLSDYHTAQFLRKNVFYLGSPLQHTFGETHVPCIWDVTLRDDGSYKLERIPTNLPRFHRVTASNSKELYRKTNSFTGDYVRVRISGVLTTDDVARIAKRVGYAYQPERANEVIEEGSSAVWSSNAQLMIRRYANANAKSKDAKRLVKLGNRLYQEGLS